MRKQTGQGEPGRLPPVSLRLRALLASASIAAAAVVSIGAVTTGAVFTDTSALASNSFTAGVVDISTTPTDAVIAQTQAAPRQGFVAPLTVRNLGNLPHRYAMTSSQTNAGLVSLTLAIKTGVTSCTEAGFTGSGTQIYFGPLPGSSGAVIGSSATGAQAGDRTLAAGASEVLCTRVLVGPGNSTPNVSAGFTFTFHAEQTQNN